MKTFYKKIVPLIVILYGYCPNCGVIGKWRHVRWLPRKDGMGLECFWDNEGNLIYDGGPCNCFYGWLFK